MLNLGTLTAIEAVVGSSGAETDRERRQILAAVRRKLGIADDPPGDGSRAATDRVLTIADAAERLAKRPRTIKYLVETGQLTGCRAGRTAKLTGIPASAVDAYIAEASCRQRSKEPQPA